MAAAESSEEAEHIGQGRLGDELLPVVTVSSEKQIYIMI